MAKQYGSNELVTSSFHLGEVVRDARGNQKYIRYNNISGKYLTYETKRVQEEVNGRKKGLVKYVTNSINNTPLDTTDSVYRSLAPNPRPADDGYDNEFNDWYYCSTNNSNDNGKIQLDKIVDKMNETINLYTSRSLSTKKIFGRNVSMYNRFKIAQPELELQNTFAHVFFTRPECNILATKSILTDQFSKDILFSSTFKSNPDIVRELTEFGNTNHSFMLSLSNAAQGFGLNDEEIKSDIYGKTYTGYAISYGKHNIESKTAGQFTVTYTDDKNLDIYRLHKLWIEYISGVYRGRYSPTIDMIMNKTIDYSSSLYYILTDETGEKILFWSKYYGVFPTTIPSSQYSWQAGTPLRPSSLVINYNYSIKEDYNPYDLEVFNINANIKNHSSMKYIPTYDKTLGHVGDTWVGTPYIEYIDDPSDGPTYYLRFDAHDSKKKK